jgi:hypothetical protein
MRNQLKSGRCHGHTRGLMEGDKTVDGAGHVMLVVADWASPVWLPMAIPRRKTPAGWAARVSNTLSNDHLGICANETDNVVNKYTARNC